MAVAADPFAQLARLCAVAPAAELPSFSVDGLTPHAVALPSTPEQAAAAVRIAAEHGWAVIPRGGGTRMSLGNVPRAADVVLCTTGLSQVIEYEPADLVATVQAGVRLGELQRILGEHGQLLPLDPPLADRATIGGIIAANASGPLRLRHGTVRDHLIGIKVVGADGSIAKAGGKVVKNVTGYDMGKLHTGALGTLGVIVEASFKLAPLPTQQSTVLAWFEELSEAFGAARAICKSALPVRACELLSPRVASEALAAAGVETLAGDGRGYVLAVLIGGSQAAVFRQNDEIIALCSAAFGNVVPAETDGALWLQVRDFGRERFDTIAKLCVLRSRAGELLGKLPGDAVWLAHVLSGVVYVFGEQAFPALPLSRELGGYAVLEACPLELKRDLDVWGPPGPDFRLMERIKREFDPKGILNPGRYLGRL